MCAIDATVWPGDFLLEAAGMLCNIASLQSNNVGFIQCPLLHQQTNLKAMVKHERKLVDVLIKNDMDFGSPLTLSYQRESVREMADKRPSSQRRVLVMNSVPGKWKESEAVTSGILGPLPTCSVLEMQGYDPDNKPNAGQRVEQTLFMIGSFFIKLKVFNVMQP